MGCMYDPIGQHFCTALQKAVILAGEPRCTAVMKEWVVGRPCMGVQGYPALLITSAIRRPAFRASPTIWGARNSPVFTLIIHFCCTTAEAACYCHMHCYFCRLVAPYALLVCSALQTQPCREAKLNGCIVQLNKMLDTNCSFLHGLFSL